MMWYITFIFDFVGDFDKLTEMRAVCKEFKKRISKRNIKALKLGDNNYYILETFNKQLIYLDCSYKQLTSLPELPNNKILYCYDNQLTSLPELPKNEILKCYVNKLTSLPELPNDI